MIVFFDFFLFSVWVLGLPSVPGVFGLIDRLESVRSMLNLWEVQFFVVGVGDLDKKRFNGRCSEFQEVND